jgi:TonB family protein
MRSCFILFVALLLSCCATAQTIGKITKYFDKDWATVSNSTQAAYYRTEEPGTGKNIIVRDYFISGQLQMIAECNGTSPSLSFNGKCLKYYADGTLESEEYYIGNVKTGRHKSFYEGGQLKTEVLYRTVPLKALYVHYYSSNGDEALTHGNGVIRVDSKDDLDRFEEIKDSVLYAMFEVNTTTHDTAYFATDKPAEYRGGLSALARDVKATLNYPKSARRAGIEGTVFVSFIVDQEGDIREAKVVKSVSPDCDAEALSVMRTLKRWIPGESHGRPVKTRFVLPIRFKFPGRG